MSLYYGASQGDLEDLKNEVDRDLCKLEDRIEDLQRDLQRKTVNVALNTAAFVKVADHNKLCDDVNEIRGMLVNQGRLLKALMASVGELNDRLDDAPEGDDAAA